MIEVFFESPAFSFWILECDLYCKYSVHKQSINTIEQEYYCD